MMPSPALTPAASRVARAAVAVIAGRGLDQLSVRSVAAQLWMAGGAVQHHFSSRSDLLGAAMGVVASSMSDRLARSASQLATRTPRDVLFLTLREALPLDELRRFEGAVEVALSAAAAVHRELHDLHGSCYKVFVDAVAGLIADADRRAVPGGRLRPGNALSQSLRR